MIVNLTEKDIAILKRCVIATLTDESKKQGWTDNRPEIRKVLNKLDSQFPLVDRAVF